MSRRTDTSVENRKAKLSLHSQVTVSSAVNPGAFLKKQEAIKVVQQDRRLIYIAAVSKTTKFKLALVTNPVKITKYLGINVTGVHDLYTEN